MRSEPSDSAIHFQFFGPCASTSARSWSSSSLTHFTDGLRKRGDFAEGSSALSEESMSSVACSKMPLRWSVAIRIVATGLVFWLCCSLSNCASANVSMHGSKKTEAGTPTLVGLESMNFAARDRPAPRDPFIV